MLGKLHAVFCFQHSRNITDPIESMLLDIVQNELHLCFVVRSTSHITQEATEFFKPGFGVSSNLPHISYTDLSQLLDIFRLSALERGPVSNRKHPRIYRSFCP